MQQLLVIGGSAGAIEPLRQIIRSIPGSCPAAILVVVHTMPDATSVLPKILSKAGILEARHVEESETLEAGQVYVARPDQHLIVKDGAVQNLRGAKENGHRPAIDTLFRSAASSAHRTIGVILSGMNSDGALGLKAIKEAGGIIIAQQPDEAEYPYMIKRAMTTRKPDYVLPSDLIGQKVMELLTGEGRDAAGNDIQSERETGLTGIEPTPYSCPECGGVLWQDGEDELLGYRCRVGHVYGFDTLLKEQSQVIDRSLWIGLRALEEKQAVLKRLADRSRSRGHQLAARRFEESAEELEEPAAIFKKLIEREEIFSVTQNDPDLSEDVTIDSRRSAGG